MESSRASQGTFSTQKKIFLRKPLANLPLHLIWPELGQMPIRMGAGEDAEQPRCIAWQLGTLPLKTLRATGVASREREWLLGRKPTVSATSVFNIYLNLITINLTKWVKKSN